MKSNCQSIWKLQCIIFSIISDCVQGITADMLATTRPNGHAGYKIYLGYNYWTELVGTIVDAQIWEEILLTQEYLQLSSCDKIRYF